MYSHLYQLYFFPSKKMMKSGKSVKISEKVENPPITSRLLPAISSHFNSKVCDLQRWKAL